MKVNKIEIVKVTSLKPIERYQYFLKRIADSEIIFILLNPNDEYVLSELDGNMLLAFWSAKEYAELCQVDGWENSYIKEISLEIFTDKMIDFIEKNNILLNIFPVKDKTGFIVSIDEFAKDLYEELDKY